MISSILFNEEDVCSYHFPHYLYRQIRLSTHIEISFNVEIFQNVNMHSGIVLCAL